MKSNFIKTTAVIIGSIIITLVLTTFVFDSNQPQLKPGIIFLSRRVVDPIVGSEGKPVVMGVDPTPPATIYY